MTIVIKDIDHYNKLIETEEQPIILWFTATWCGPCKRVAPFYNNMANKINECNFCIVDIDEHNEITDSYGITSILLFFFKK